MSPEMLTAVGAIILGLAGTVGGYIKSRSANAVAARVKIDESMADAFTRGLAVSESKYERDIGGMRASFERELAKLEAQVSVLSDIVLELVDHVDPEIAARVLAKMRGAGIDASDHENG